MAYTGSLVIADPQAANWPKGIDWTAYLAYIDAAETIVTSTWTVSGADDDLTVDVDSIVVGALKTQLRLSGGTVGLRYVVTNHITTSSGVEDDRSFTVLIQER
jgi:hypothetical protein